MTTTSRQSLSEYVEWFRTDLVYAAPETWPERLPAFLDTLAARVAELEAVEKRAWEVRDGRFGPNEASADIAARYILGKKAGA